MKKKKKNPLVESRVWFEISAALTLPDDPLLTLSGKTRDVTHGSPILRPIWDDMEEELTMVEGNGFSDMGWCGKEREEAMTADLQKKKLREYRGVENWNTNRVSLSEEGESAASACSWLFSIHVREPAETGIKNKTPA